MRRIWASLPEDVEVVLLTSDAASALAGVAPVREGVLTAVMAP